MEHQGTSQSNICCLCGRNVPSWNNPEPLRSGDQDCCEMCNRLVGTARIRLSGLPDAQRPQYLSALRAMSYSQLYRELSADEG